MRKKLLLCAVTISLLTVFFTGCTNSKETKEADTPTTIAETATETPTPTPTETPTPTSTETPHTHNYTSSVTKNATCSEKGVKTYICECGESYSEEIATTNHQYGEYISDGNASLGHDGTKTATCSVCSNKDTITDEGSKLSYTYTDLTATKYVKSSVNVRSLPCTDGEKMGGLSTGNEVTVTGQCNETGWYRINYNGSTAYVSNSYLIDNKPVETKPVETQQIETQPVETETNSSVDLTYQPYSKNWFFNVFDLKDVDDSNWTLCDDGVYRFRYKGYLSEWNGYTIAEYEATMGYQIYYDTPTFFPQQLPNEYDSYVIGTYRIIRNWNLGSMGIHDVELPY